GKRSSPRGSEGRRSAAACGRTKDVVGSTIPGALWRSRAAGEARSSKIQSLSSRKVPRSKTTKNQTTKHETQNTNHVRRRQHFRLASCAAAAFAVVFFAAGGAGCAFACCADGGAVCVLCRVSLVADRAGRARGVSQHGWRIHADVCAADLPGSGAGDGAGE